MFVDEKIESKVTDKRIDFLNSRQIASQPAGEEAMTVLFNYISITNPSYAGSTPSGNSLANSA